jgi:hypothetical protein
MRIKSFIAGLLIGGIIISGLTIFANETLKVISNPYPIYVDGQRKDISAYNINDSTYLGLTDTATVLNTSVKYDKNTKSINVDTNQTELDEGITNDKIDELNIYQKNEKQYVKFEDVFNLLSVKNHNDICLTYCENYEVPHPNQIVKVENFDLYLNILNNNRIFQTLLIVGNIPCIYVSDKIKCISIDDYNQYFKPLLPKNIMEIKEEFTN